MPVADPPQHLGTPARSGGDLQASTRLGSPRRQVAQAPPAPPVWDHTRVVLPSVPVVTDPHHQVGGVRAHGHTNACRPGVAGSVGDALSGGGHDVVGGLPVHSVAHRAFDPHGELAGEATGCGVHRSEESPVQGRATRARRAGALGCAAASKVSND